HPGKGGWGDHGERGRGGRRRADRGGEPERRRRRRAEGVGAGGGKAVHQPGPEAGPAEVTAQHLLLKRQDRGGGGRRVHDERPPEIAARGHALPQPPASADRKNTVSPAASGISPSRVSWSPFRAATTCRSSASPVAAAAPATVAARTGCGPWWPLARVPNRCTVTSGAGRARAAW